VAAWLEFLGRRFREVAVSSSLGRKRILGEEKPQIRAGLRHVWGVWPNRGTDFRGTQFSTLKILY